MPVGPGKTVLLLDYYCTDGKSLRAGGAITNSIGTQTNLHELEKVRRIDRVAPPRR